MTKTGAYQHLRDSPTKMKMLRTLWWFTGNEDYPTARKLAVAIDVREAIPRATLHTRRKMLHELRDAGLAQPVVMEDSEHTHYAITPAGIELIKAMDLESQL